MNIVWLGLVLFALSCQPGAQNTPGDKGNHMFKYTNHLIHETSPYLLQHAHNPVNWYPWGQEAFERAQKEDKPILLSVGYSACHWCHVMEKESFENEEIAKLMNEHYVCIKVDREERPDVDQVYMKFVQMMTGSGGWPMTVFLTPDRQPYFGGTYFPPEDRYGKPGFKRLLTQAADFYHNRKQDLNQNLQQMQQAFDRDVQKTSQQSDTLPDSNELRQAEEQLSRYYDAENGGIGSAPKFPAVQSFMLLLRAWKESGQEHYLAMVEHTLKKMAQGGIYDQLGGGFARYSVDARWFAPHFEKMLYDNAQLATLYLETFQATGNAFYLRIAEETLDFVMRELHSEEGGFYSSLDADSEGEEGRFYLWTRAEIFEALDEANATLFCERFDVREAGNFEGKNILHISKPVSDLADSFQLSPKQVETRLQQIKKRLLEIRKQRVRPELDSKVLLSWNGLMLSAFAKAFQITQKPVYKTVIDKNIRFVTTTMKQQTHLLHTYKDRQAKQDGFLDDYANYIMALIDSYEALNDPQLLQQASRLAEQVVRDFWDEQGGGFFFTSASQEKLILRLKDDSDQSTPSGTGIMTLNLLRLNAYTGNEVFRTISEHIFRMYTSAYGTNPYGYASHLVALDFYLNHPKECIILVPEHKDGRDLSQIVFNTFLPNKIILVQNPQRPNPVFTSDLLAGRELQGEEVTAYVCQNFTCSLPVTSAKAFKQLLEQ